VRHEARSSSLALDKVQAWMQAVIVHPGSIGEALVSQEAATVVPAEELDQLVRPSWSLTAAERVEVYHGMYLLRMAEALETDYPALRHFLGEHAFETLVRDYVQAFPSRSYTLNRLGDHLPRFLMESWRHPQAAFLSDLARAELAITEAFDEEESSPVDGATIAGIAPEAWATARLRPIRALRLVQARYEIVSHLEAAKRGEPSHRPRRRATFLVFYRRAYSVLRLELTRPEYELLAQLVGGATLGDAIAQAALGLKESKREQAVFRWFRTWLAEGLFASVETSSCSPSVAGVRGAPAERRRRPAQ
jgi:hypothetical protein